MKKYNMKKYEEVCRPVHGPRDRKIPLQIAYGLSPAPLVRARRLRDSRNIKK